MDTKARRRVHVGEHLTFLFENTETIRYQVQEMMRAERIVKEEDIRHELDTYNELLGAPGELSCTLLDRDRGSRRAQSRSSPAGAAWSTTSTSCSTTARKIYASYDPRQVGEERLSSVHYLKFAVPRGARRWPWVPTSKDLTAETRFSDEQREALDEDLKSDQ